MLTKYPLQLKQIHHSSRIANSTIFRSWINTLKIHLTHWPASELSPRITKSIPSITLQMQRMRCWYARYEWLYFSRRGFTASRQTPYYQNTNPDSQMNLSSYFYNINYLTRHFISLSPLQYQYEICTTCDLLGVEWYRYRHPTTCSYQQYWLVPVPSGTRRIPVMVPCNFCNNHD